MNDMNKDIWELETGEVRDIYIDRAPHSTRDDGAAAEFDNWLAKIKADAWDEGRSAGHHDRDNYRLHHNPYR